MKRKAAKRKKDRPQGSCAGCAHCCGYVAMEIDKPTTWKDFDHIFWYVLHRNVWVYVDTEGDWYVQFNSRCAKLRGRKCSIYAGRPKICRAYDPIECTHHDERAAEKYLFKNSRDLFQYLAKKRPAICRKLHEELG